MVPEVVQPHLCAGGLWMLLFKGESHPCIEDQHKACPQPESHRSPTLALKIVVHRPHAGLRHSGKFHPKLAEVFLHVY